MNTTNTNSIDPAHNRLGTGADSAPTTAQSAASPTSPCGPAPNLIALPDCRGVALAEPAIVEALLDRLEAARRRQLDEVGPTNSGVVAAAYRASIESILTQTRAARERLAAGLYGTCEGCEANIPAPRLDVRPWTTRCASCSSKCDP